MPDEEKVRTKRRKLDCIITKLHQAVPLGSESLEEEENLNEAVKENVNKRNEPLTGSSRRKLHRASKQNQIDEDASNARQTKPEVTEDVVESHATENGMEMDAKQDVHCNGEGNASNEIQTVCVPAVVKKEPVENYENSLEGLQQMLGYNISEEVVNTKEDASGKKKRLLSESSDADGHVIELPRRVECTACGRNVNPAHGTICRHPCLQVLVCKKCSQYYNSGPFTRDEFGIEEQCRWCGDGGSLLCCDKCDKAFCKSCIKRNLGKSMLKDIVNAPEGVEWLCFVCNPKPLSRLVRTCNQIMNILQMLKAQKTIFKTKKGPSLTDTPNQKERRNRLSSLTENLGMSSDGALSPNESQEKLLVPGGDEDDSNDNDFAIKQSNVKARTRAGNKKHNKQNGSSKKDVVIIDDDNDSNSGVQSGKGSKGKTNKVQADHHRNKRKLEVNTESDEKSKNKSRTSKAQKTRRREDSSSDSDSDEEKQNTKSKPKPTRKTKSKEVVAAKSSEEEQDAQSDSDSDSDFVSMVKGKGKEMRNNSKIQKKGKTTQAVSDSEEEESEKDGKAKRSKTTRAAKKDDEKQKKGKTKKAVSDSEEEEDEDEESKKDRKKKAQRKAKEAKNDSKKGKKGKTRIQVVSDSEEEEDEEEEEEEKSEKDRKGKTSKKTKEARKNNKMGKKEKTKNQVVSDSEEEEEEEESENNRKKKLRSRKTSVSQKKTRKRPRRVTSSEDESKSSEDQSDSDVPSTRFKKKQPHKQSKKKRKVASESDDDEEEEIGRRKEQKSRQRGKKSSSESEKEKKKTKQKGKGKGKGKKKSGKKHYIEKDSDESEEEDEEVSPSKPKGRKKIRKLIEDEKLAEETQKARRLEEERRKRLLERTQNNEDDLPGESAKVSRLVLESDPSTKEPIVEVKEDILQHLKPHQCKGIQFMYNCVIESVKSWKKEEPGGGCILAHCMGLGKTLQVVALVHTLVTHQDINMQRILVVAPLNTVLNWQVEFEKWLSVDDRLEVLILQEVGGDNWRRADMLKHWLRYGGVLIMGYSMYRNLSQCYRIRSKHHKKIFQEALVDPGPELVVCDEGHILRNDGSAISRALNSIKTKRRVVLTGTPLQNNLIEYHCMVSFVKPNLLGTRKEFTNTFVNPIQNGQCADSTVMDVQIMKQRCHVLHKMLEGCVQRRDYAVLIPFLPRKHEYVIKVRLSALQRKLYQHFLSTFVFQEGDLGKKGVSLFSDYQALMRIWTHPWCLKLEALRRPETFADTDDSMDDFVVHTDEEEEEEEESEKSTTSEEDEEESSSESEDDRKHNKHRRRRGNKVSSSDEDDSDDDSVDEVIPQSKRRKAAVTHSAQSSSNKASKSSVNIDGEDITVVEINEGASTSRGNQGDKKAHFIKNNTKEEEGKAMSKSNGKQLRDSPNNDSNNNSDLETVGSTRSGMNFKDYEVEKEWYDEFLTEEDQYNVELSGKLFLLMEILADAEAVGDKVLVFSQSLVTLDLIEKVLGGGDIGGDRENWCRGCDYFRMDGSTSAAMRQRWADIFNDEDNKNARLFLISTKAGGLGINLVAANRVIVFDVSWNPSHDVQSIFRVYRFGQSKAVYVYRFIAQGTMEEKIYDRQVTKLSMSGRVVDEQQIERHFTAADLRELYTFTPDVLEEDKETEPGKEAAAGNETEAAKETNAEVTAVTEAEKTTESGKEMEAGKETNAGTKTEAEGKDEDRNQTEDGKESDSGAAKETEATKETTERPTLPLPKDAVLADLINRLHPKWIVKYHEHDSLLQNIESEELTEEEMKAAWAAYEAEKSGQVAPAYARMADPLQEHARTQEQVVARIRMNTEMLQQIQQIRQLQQQQEIEERMRQQREQLYQQQRVALLQQHQRQQDEIRRQNQLRFIQHMTQAQPGQQLQLGPNTINVQTQLPPTAAAPHHPPPPPIMRFQLPPAIRVSAPPVGATSSSVTPPTINLTLGPRNIGGTLSNNNPQLIPPPQNIIPE